MAMMIEIDICYFVYNTLKPEHDSRNLQRNFEWYVGSLIQMSIKLVAFGKKSPLVHVLAWQRPAVGKPSSGKLITQLK